MISLVKLHWRWYAGASAAVLVACALAISLPRYGLERVGTAVMNPAVAPGETVVLDDSRPVEQVARGDVVVTSSSWGGSAAGLTIRVVGLEGDTVVCCDDDGRLSLNGVALVEPYAHGDNAAFGTFTVTVPAGSAFVLGDARSVSVDSRSHLASAGGTLPVTAISARVVAVVGPVWKARPVGDSDPLLWLVVGFLLVGVAAGVLAAWRPVASGLSAAYQALGRRLFPAATKVTG